MRPRPNRPPPRPRAYTSNATSIGCGLDYLLQRKLEVQVIVTASEGGDNCHQLFHDAYLKYARAMQIEPTTFYVRVPDDFDRLEQACKLSGIQLEKFEFNGQDTDYYALLQIMPILQTNPYSLIDEVREMPLLKSSSNRHVDPKRTTAHRAALATPDEKRQALDAGIAAHSGQLTGGGG